MKHSILAACCLVACACVSNNPARDAERPKTAYQQPAEPVTGRAEVAANERAPEQSKAAPAPVPDAPRPVEASADVVDKDVVIARVAGEEIYAGELLSFWMHNRSEEVREMLEHLVSAKLIGLEARRLDVELDEDEIDLGLLQSIQQIEEEIRKQDPTTSFREFVEVRLGLDSARYKQQLRWEVERKLLGERVVRAFVMGQERTELKVIVLRSKAEIEAARQRVEGGEDFAVVARELSIDPSSGFGGHIPPVLRNGTALSALAFATPPGALGGPLEMEGRWLLLEVESRLDPVVGDWAEVGDAVLASLRDEPLADAEYWQWKTEMRERYNRDLEPFFELISEPKL
ncbi:MAG: peptidyl-prolyl cis-trans isomerase [Planctomycetes bacterium]|nr:peptidyl-prolyl cis-trans isomerase [Planctomycetota bacterium]